MYCKITGKQCEYTGCNETHCIADVAFPKTVIFQTPPLTPIEDTKDSWDEAESEFHNYKKKSMGVYKSVFDWLKQNYNLIKK